MAKTTDLSIIILNYNTSDWLENVLSSIEAFPLKKHSFEVIVVDNASSDDSVEVVKNKFPSVKLIQSPDNSGFAKGNNLGIQKATGKYVMLLNSDAEFTAETDLDACVEYMNKHEFVGVVSPKLVLADGSIDLASHRGEPTPWAALSYLTGLEKLIPNSKIFGQYHQTWQNFNEVHEIEACSGAAMIVRHEAIDTAGMLDEAFFMYAEDLDWCKRIREAGYQIVFYPLCTIIHHKYKSGQSKSDEVQVEKFLQIPGFPNKPPVRNIARFHFYDTMKQYYTKHYQSTSPIQTWFIHKTVDFIHWWKNR